MKMKSESENSQLCLTLSDPMDCSPPGFPVHGIFQARVLEWGIQKSTSNKCWRGCGERKGNHFHCWWECKLIQTLWRTMWRFLKNLEIELPYNPASHCWAYTPRKPELKETCTRMMITALFTIARTWKQPRCPLADEWIRKLWYIYTMEYYSMIKENTFESVLMRWIKLEPIIQGEVSQKEKHQYSISSVQFSSVAQ